MWRRKQREQDFEREIRAHLALEEEEQRESGTARDEAPYAARRAFGNITRYREVIREMWGWSSLERLGQDLRYAIRMMRKSPGFTLVALLSLTLGIGGNTAIYSLMNAVMLRSLPVQEPDRLLLFGKGNWGGITDGMPDRSWQLFSYPFYREVERSGDAFTGVAAMMSLPNNTRAAVSGSRDSEAVSTRLVSGTYFDVLGVKPAAGRTFTDAEDQTPGANPVAVMSYSWWQRRFGGDPSAVGKTIAIGATVYTIIGAAPPEFFGTTVGDSPDLWIPLAMNAQLPPAWGGEEARTGPLFQSLYILARLKPGVTEAQAGARVNLMFKQNLRSIAGSSPSARDLNAIRRASIELTPGGRGLSRIRRQFSTSLWLLMGAVGLVLLIACANIANLLLARAAGRQREIAVRLTLGAGRMRLIRQMLTESVLLAVVGGGAGVAFAAWAGRLLVRMVSTGSAALPLQTGLDGTVLVFTTLLSLATGILFGLAPALRATRVDLSAPLKEGRAAGLARTRSLLAKALIVSQVALSAVLLIGAGLFIRSLVNLRHVSTGFDKENVLLVETDKTALGYKNDDPRLTMVYRQVEQRVSQIPGVRAAAFSMFTFRRGEWTDSAYPSGRPAPPESRREIHNNLVGPAFFTAMGIPVTLGRTFNLNDTAKSPKVAIVNETMARIFFPGETPIGLRFGLSPEQSGEFEVVGVVKDAKYENLRETPTPMAFYPDAQRVQFLGSLVVRHAGDQRAIVPAIRRAVAEVSRNLPITEVNTLAGEVDDSLVSDRLTARLSSFFGLLALLLASIGIYGVLSYAVARRTSEVGLRMALGAPRSSVVWLVMRDVLLLVTIGLGIGVPAALAGERLISGLLYGLPGLDAVSILAAIAILAAVAGFAAYWPARRASLVDPAIALRYE
jgi:predicted permease